MAEFIIMQMNGLIKRRNERITTQIHIHTSTQMLCTETRRFLLLLSHFISSGLE